MSQRAAVIVCLAIFLECSCATLPLHPRTNSAGRTSPIKNVLFIMSDDLKGSVLGCYGDTRCQTPNIDRLAGEGMRFTRAYAQGTVCAPSRPSILYGRYTRPRINPGIHRSFPEYLKQNGWYSARVGKVFHMAVPRDIAAGSNGVDYPQAWTERFNSPGLEEATPGAYECLNQNVFQRSLENRAGARHDDRMYVAVKMDGDGSDQPDVKTANKAIELLREHKDKPFVLAVGFIRPHYPMVAPSRFFEQYPWEDVEMPERRENDWDDIPAQGIPKFTSFSKGLDRYPDNQKRMWASYYAAVSFVDEQVGKVLAELDRLGLRESTAVVFTSDHGFHLGEHDFWQKSDLHEEAVRVPLIISAPGYPAGTTDALVELVDLYPTITSLLNLETPEYCEGVSLTPVLKDAEAEVRSYAFSYHGIMDSDGPPHYALRGKGWSYMYYADNVEELYDMERDPEQFTNLALNPDYRPRLDEFRRVLHEKLEALN